MSLKSIDTAYSKKYSIVQKYVIEYKQNVSTNSGDQVDVKFS